MRINEDNGGQDRIVEAEGEVERDTVQDGDVRT